MTQLAPHGITRFMEATPEDLSRYRVLYEHLSDCFPVEMGIAPNETTRDTDDKLMVLTTGFELGGGKKFDVSTIIIEADERVITGVSVARYLNGTHHMYGLGVHRDYQGRGLGTTLVDAAIEHVRSRDGTVLQLSVSSANPRARAWYERLRFTLSKHLLPHPIASGSGIYFEKLEMRL